MRLYLTYRDVGHERYWYAEERQTIVRDGRRCLVRKTHSLHVKGKRSRRTAEAALADMERSSGFLPQSNMTVAEWCSDYLVSCRDTVRPRTQEMKRYWLARFVAACPVRMCDLTNRHIEAWRSALASVYAPTSVNIALRVALACIREARRRGVISDDGPTHVRPVAVPLRTYPAYLSLSQFAAVLSTVRVQRHRVAYCLAMYAGLRLGEAANLKWSCVDMGRREIRIESDDGWQTKSGRGRTVPMYDILASELSRLSRSCEYVLGIDGAPDDHAISRRWRETVRRADVPRVTYHGLRHSFATWLAQSGLNLRALQSIMGHASISTTMIYMHVQPALAVEAARAFEPRSESSSASPASV